MFWMVCLRKTWDLFTPRRVMPVSISVMNLPFVSNCALPCSFLAEVKLTNCTTEHPLASQTEKPDTAHTVNITICTHLPVNQNNLLQYNGTCGTTGQVMQGLPLRHRTSCRASQSLSDETHRDNKRHQTITGDSLEQLLRR